MPDRSYLFVPGDRPERFDKALQSGAHAVILDLEDAVMPERKSAARDAIWTWLESASTPVYVRVNPVATSWYEDDCALLQLPSVRGVMLPKTERADELEDLASKLQANQHTVALIESVAGWFDIAALARAPKVQRLAFGSFDFMLDSGIKADGAELDAVRSQLVLHSRYAGLPAPIDGVSLATDDEQQLMADVTRSRRWGLGAKLCIHPKQVSVVNTGLAPTLIEVQWAHRVIDALGAGTLGAIAVDGKLVDKPIAQMAQSILDEVGTG